MLRKFIIEREIAGVGGLGEAELGEAARTSNRALGRLEGIQWQQSYVTAERNFCVYLAESEETIREHARLSGFPATRITEVVGIIDPTTEQFCALATA